MRGPNHWAMRGPNHGINVKTFLVQAFWIQAVHHEPTPAKLSHFSERHRRPGGAIGLHPCDIGWIASAFSTAVSTCLAATTASPCVSYANATSGLPLSSVMLKPQ